MERLGLFACYVSDRSEDGVIGVRAQGVGVRGYAYPTAERFRSLAAHVRFFGGSEGGLLAADGCD